MRKLYTDDKGHTRSYEHTEPVSDFVLMLIAVATVTVVLGIFIYGLSVFGLLDFS